MKIVLFTTKVGLLVFNLYYPYVMAGHNIENSTIKKLLHWAMGYLLTLIAGYGANVARISTLLIHTQW